MKLKIRILLLVLTAGLIISGTMLPAQNFGAAFQRKKVVLVRKLPPTGHIDGSTFALKVNGAGVPADVTAGLQSTLESLLISNDVRLRSVTDKDHPDAIINCQITTYSQPPPQMVQQQGVSFGKKPAPAQMMTHVTGLMTVTFNAQDARGSKSISADTVTAKFDQEFMASNPQQQNRVGSVTSILSHLPKTPQAAAGEESERAPTPPELRDSLIKNIAFQIASHLVNTSEQVPVQLARGGGLDEADTLMDQKLWTRALEQLETMKPFDQSEEDAYRLYNLGVANEALGYQSEDVTKARKYLQEAAIDYGKAIDAKPSEKYFLQPQTRIDTALAHYKTIGDQMAASAKVTSAAVSPADAPVDALTNNDVISMVQARLDEANIIDTVQHAPAVKFDLTARGQIELSKGNVNGRIISAMKQRARSQH